jgi:hypothetical protein
LAVNRINAKFALIQVNGFSGTPAVTRVLIHAEVTAALVQTRLSSVTSRRHL